MQRLTRQIREGGAARSGAAVVECADTPAALPWGQIVVTKRGVIYQAAATTRWRSLLRARNGGNPTRPGGCEMNERNAEIRRMLEAAGFRYKPSPKGHTTVRPVPRSVADKLRSRLRTDKPEAQGD